MQPDFLIIGQGISGTCMAFYLMQRGAKVFVMDKGETHTASKAAPALINPVTGRKFVKTWQCDTLLPLASKFYSGLADLLGRKFHYACHILRALPDEAALRRWEKRGEDPGYRSYIDPVVQTAQFPCFEPFRYGITRGAMRVLMPELIDSFRAYLESRKAFRQERFYPGKLKYAKDDVSYNDIHPGAVIFCDGYRALEHGLMPVNCLLPNKGEYLLCRIPDLKIKPDTALKYRIFFIPVEKDIYWVGATYERAAADNNPTAKAFRQLQGTLEELLTCPWEALEHRTGIRPTVKDRRPVIGKHPEKPRMYFLNGMGTKAASLAPFCARILSECIFDKKEIPHEIALDRWIENQKPS